MKPLWTLSRRVVGSRQEDDVGLRERISSSDSEAQRDTLPRDETRLSRFTGRSLHALLVDDHTSDRKRSKH